MRLPGEGQSSGSGVTATEPAHRVLPEGVVITAAPPQSQAWFTARRGGITGTDLPKILGLTKYGNALSVWLDKRDELDDEAGEAARWGNILEEPVAEEWAERNDTMVQRIGVVAHEDRDWCRASLDRLVMHGACPDGGFDCGLEVKTRSAFKAADWRDGIPDDTLAQVSWGLLVTGLDHMHVAALIGGQRLSSYRVDRDPVLEDYLVQQAASVWAAVQAGEPPEVGADAEGVLLDLLDRLYAERTGTIELDGGYIQPWLDKYADGLELERQARALKTEAKTELVQVLGGAEIGLVGEYPVFTYKRPEAMYGLTADEHRRLRRQRPDVWQQLVDDGFITLTTPGPRFALKGPKKETDE